MDSKKKINELKKEAGQPNEEPTNKEKKQIIDIMVEKVSERLKNNICKRCHGTIFGKEGDYCDGCQVKVDRDQRFQVEKEIKRIESNIRNFDREIKFKQAQIDAQPYVSPTEIIETRIIKHTDKGEPVIIDGYTNGLKPRYILENEVDQITSLKELHEKQITEMKKSLEEKDAAAKDSGDKGKTSN